MTGGFRLLAYFALAAPQVAAQDASPLVVRQDPIPPADAGIYSGTLPANTQVSLSVNDAITTKGQRWHEGDTFNLTVTHAVRLGNYIVIPRGSRAVGRITWMTDKGAFGKSGKMDFDIEYVEASGRRIPVAGHFRQEGEGNTVATVGAVVAVGLFAGFVTGRSATVPQGRELTVYTKEDLPVIFDGPPLPARTAAAAPTLANDEPMRAVPISQPNDVRRRANPSYQGPSAPQKGRGGKPRVRCITCQY